MKSEFHAGVILFSPQCIYRSSYSIDYKINTNCKKKQFSSQGLLYFFISNRPVSAWRRVAQGEMR